MGLDMYLTAKVYLSQYNEETKEISEKIASMMQTALVPKEVSFEAAYWRKANAIHKWFVDNVQNGEDECKEYYVSRKDLQALIDTCKAVLKDNTLADSLLPPQAGFFFGSTDIDEYYRKDLEDTVESLEKIMVYFDNPKWDFYYQSSW